MKIASFDGTRLTYAGSVGTGFSEAVAALSCERLDALATSRCPGPGLKTKDTV